MALGLQDSIILLISLAFSLGIFVPLYGIVVRFRANFNPKALQLDTEGGAQAHTGPVVKTLFAMAKRVYRLEGWPGLFKGLMPTVLSSSIFTLFLISFYDVKQPRHGRYSSPKSGVLGTLAYSLFSMLVSLPIGVITIRAITTPHKLPYFRPMYSLRILLTSTERRRPWIIYLTPGLLASQVAHIAYVVLFLRTLRHFLLSSSPNSQVPRFKDTSSVRLIIYFVVVLFSTAILTPLEVIATRLMIQRNHASSSFNLEEEEGVAEELMEYAGAEEDVIGLRNESDPYLSLSDCAKKIVDEEGLPALYRAWWLTGLGAFSGAIS